jgi:hypothetical protein
MEQSTLWAVGLSLSQLDTLQLVGILLMNDRPVLENYTRQITTPTRDRHPRPAGLELASPARKWLQTHALDRDVTGIDEHIIIVPEFTV